MTYFCNKCGYMGEEGPQHNVPDNFGPCCYFAADMTDYADRLANWEPRWVCLEGMNRDELAAYDYGCAGMMDALQRILDGRDTGEGSCNEPWASLRNEVLRLKKENEALRGDLWWLVGGGEFAHWVNSGIEMPWAAMKEWEEARRHFPELKDE